MLLGYDRAITSEAMNKALGIIDPTVRVHTVAADLSLPGAMGPGSDAPIIVRSGHRLTLHQARWGCSQVSANDPTGIEQAAGRRFQLRCLVPANWVDVAQQGIKLVPRDGAWLFCGGVWRQEGWRPASFTLLSTRRDVGGDLPLIMSRRLWSTWLSPVADSRDHGFDHPEEYDVVPLLSAAA